MNERSDTYERAKEIEQWHFVDTGISKLRKSLTIRRERLMRKWLSVNDNHLEAVEGTWIYLVALHEEFCKFIFPPMTSADRTVSKQFSFLSSDSTEMAAVNALLTARRNDAVHATVQREMRPLD